MLQEPLCNILRDRPSMRQNIQLWHFFLAVLLSKVLANDCQLIVPLFSLFTLYGVLQTKKYNKILLDLEY